jgi:integrase
METCRAPTPAPGYGHGRLNDRDARRGNTGADVGLRQAGEPFIILPITKNNTSRVVPIHETLYRILAQMPQKSGYVFGNGNGGHIGDMKHSFTSACKKAGITDFRFHGLRHAYASQIICPGYWILISIFLELQFRNPHSPLRN